MLKKQIKPASSIKTKLNLTLISIIFIMFIMITVPIFIGYKPYYKMQQKDFLSSANSQLEDSYPSTELLVQSLIKISNSHYINAFILNKEGNILYSTTRLVENREAYTDIYQGIDLSKTNLINNNNSHLIYDSQNKLSNIQSIQLATTTSVEDDVYIIVFEKPIGDMNSVVTSIVLFVFMCVLPMGVISALVVTRVSNFLISPILELADISNEIANFNFDTPITTKTNDEIGILSNNIEKLSLELKSKLQELEEQNKLLKTSIVEKDKNAKIQREFISNVSHELKTPITLILGYSEALKLDIDEETKKEYMGIIISESHKMNNLISDMLDISRLQSGDKQLIKEEFDFSELVNKLINKHKITFDKNNINLSFDIKDGIMIEGDKSKLELVLSNFVVNANRYVDDKKDVKIKLIEENDKYIFKIYNSANKFSQDDIKKIWGSFYKIDKAHSREKGGTGIGLYLVKTILELHEFEYGVINIDEGVEFFIEIHKNKSS